MEGFFGRKKESEQLGQVFARVQRGRFEQAMVIGEGGVGKTALVRQLALAAEQNQGSFVFGKADRRRAGTPLAPVRGALDMMVKKAIADHPKDMAAMGKTVADLIGPDLYQAISLLPALKFLFSDAAAYPATKSPEDEAPFLNNLLYCLLEAFGPRSKGLVLFLDDLQWLDGASHKFLAHLSVAPALPGVMLVMGFRSQDTNTLPGLSRTRSLYQSLDTCISLELKGLFKRDVTAFLKNRLETRQDVAPLCDLCFEKTAGNPFYLIQLVDDLLEEGAVQQKSSEWVYDISQITGMGFSENVADLIISRIQMLDEGTLILLKHGACIQGGISVELLSAGTGFVSEKVETLLWKPLQLKFLEKRASEYHFTHDKILEAVDGMITPPEREGIHRMLFAFYLAKNLGPGPKPSVFTLLHHYDFYSALVNDPDLKRKMTPHYLIAGQEAKEKTAYTEALGWLKKGMAHFPGDMWQDDYSLALAFSRLAAECAYLAGDFQAAEQIFIEVDEKARSFDDRLAVEMVKISYYQAAGEFRKALITGIRVLDHLGIHVPENPSWIRVVFSIFKTWTLLAVKRPSVFLKKQMPQEGRARQVVKVVTALGSIAYYLSPKKFLPFINAVGLEYSLRYGTSAETPLECIGFGLVLNHMTGSVKWGRKLGAIARQISRQQGYETLGGKEMLATSFLFDHWDRSMPEIIAACEKGQEVCLRQGDHEYYAYNTITLLTCMLLNGTHLHRILAKSIRERAKLKRLNHSYCLTVLAIQFRALDNLKQGRSQPWELGKDFFDGDESAKKDQGQIIDLAFSRLSTAFFCGRYDSALKIKQEVESIFEGEKGTLLYCYFCFIAAILEINEGRNRKKIKKYLKILKWCAANNPRYYQPWYQVAQGEFLRIKGDLDKAGDCFQAARKALEKDPDALYVKALVLEKLGRINEAKNDIQGAEKFLQDAVTLYRQWGLKWKHGLFDADETDVSETDNSIDNAMDVISPPPSPSGQTVPKDDLENILFRIYDISHAEAVHAVVLNARQWQSQVSVANDSVLRPSILVDLPQQMLSFASAAGKATRATANDLEEDFFDTAYFFKHKPESLVVVPGGTDKGICIENPEQDLNMDAINKLAEQVFKRLKPQADADPDLPEKDTQELLQLKACCQKLKYHMKRNKLYRDPDLTRISLASTIGISPRMVTDALSICLDRNLQAFVNSYRVEAVKKAMKNPDASGKSLLEIALAEGFNSKTSFNRAFKNQTGMTPSQYLKKRPWERDGQTT